MEEFDDFCYNKKDLIGHGAFAIVYKGRCKSKNFEVAIKAIAKKNISKVKNLLNKEIRISKELTDLKHENLVALLKCVESPTHVFLVMEYCNGGDLADYLNTYERINEPTIQHFFSQIANAIEAMNKKNVVHRDLKPQNILLCNPQKSANTHSVSPKQLIVKLADFGFARELTDGRMAGTLCGSPMYMAPEVIMSHQYCAKADLWSIGTIMYQCLTGKAPFIAQTPQQLKNKYETARELYPKIPDFCSAPLSDLLVHLLKKDPKDRIEFVDFFNHSFFHTPLGSASSAQQILHQRHDNGIYSPSSAHVRARFTVPTLTNHGSNGALNTGNNTSPRHHFHHQGGPTPIEPLGLTAHRYVGNSTTLASPRLTSGTSAATESPRQPLRPSLASPVVHRANIPSSYATNFSPRHTYQHSNELITDSSKDHRSGTMLFKQQSSGAPTAAIAPTSPPRLSHNNNPSGMTDSNDFTFLPPLDKANGSQRQQQSDLMSTHKNHLQFSNTLSTTPTTSSTDNNPVKQVQVHSSTPDRGDPVPSQRLVYAQMQERRKASGASPVPNILAPTAGNANERIVEHRIPSVEELNLPETQFVLHEVPRPIRRNQASANSLFRESGTMSPAKTSMRLSFIPKSTTFNELSSAGDPNTSSTEAGRTLGVSRTLSIPLTTRIPTEQESIANADDHYHHKATNNASPTACVRANIRLTHGEKDINRTSESSKKSTSEEEEEEYSINNPLQLPFSSGDVVNRIEEPMEESLMSQVMDSISGDEELSGRRKNSANYNGEHSLRTASRITANNIVDRRNKDGREAEENVAAAADLLFNAEPPPELEAETILDGEHRQVLAKLRFVLELIETLINVAENKTNPMAMIMEGGTRKSRHQSSAALDANRRAEQLVLYVRSLHVLSSALVMAQRQISSNTLKPSPAVQDVINQLNEKYHQCLARSQELASLGIPGTDPTMTVVSAEKIMYQHAIDLCQSAALDELFGHPQLCPKRYQTAYMMLHTLFEQVQNEQDKSVLAKYKNAVEKRMRILEQQGFVTTVNINEQQNHYSLSHHQRHSPHKTLLKESDPV